MPNPQMGGYGSEGVISRMFSCFIFGMGSSF